MDTLANLNVSSTVAPVVSTDDSTPEGFFTATARILGVTTTYLLRGETTDRQAPIVGRVELHEDWMTGKPKAVGYKGDRLKGGTPVSDCDSYSEFFASFIR